jgi:hypothetical protein
MKMIQLVAQHPTVALGCIGNYLQYVSQIIYCCYQPHFYFHGSHHPQLLANVIVASDSKLRKVKKFIVEVDNVVFGPVGSAAVLTLTNDLDSESLYL